MNFLNSLNEFSKDFTRIYEAYPFDLSSKEREKLDWELCSRGTIPEAELIRTYSRITEIKIREEDELTNVEKFPKISLEYLENFCFIPFKWDEKSVELVVSSPYRIDSIAYIFKQLYDMDSTFSYARRSVLERLIQETYNKESQEEEQGFGPADSQEALMNMATEAKIVRLVNEVFSRAVEMNASDIHVEPEENKYAIRFRIDGNLQEFMTGSINQYPAVASRIKLVGGLNIAESRLPQDGRTNIHLGKSEIDMRINTIPTLSGESIVLRLLRKDAMVFNLKNTGMIDGMRKRFEGIITLPHGIILVVGPTGSGKSTTLYSIMSQLNTPEVKIITIEDPVEYRIPGLSQMQVNPKIGLNFSNALRNIVRQDPDIILVGEIRDKETADIAINAALTGHLVLSTLHTNDAVGAISRLLDMGAEGFLIASSLVAVLSQRLVRRICKDCNGKSATDHTIKCKTCSSSGFKGRLAIMELLVIDDEVRQAIIKNTDSSTLNKIAIKNGMIPIQDDGIEKVKAGLTTEPEVYVAAKKD
ncbi:MAG TPA: type II secretion system protein GspE [Lentisphaeria bacterium]|nr:MAG: hypothetical protein A2X47_03090 [Lentisphaerae bacterium GWF2_38_69]HBM15332.1 type II secretion system protein GspE [Lentisphaeria bacterium]